MKKVICLLMVILSVLCVFSLNSCKEEEEHEHDFGEWEIVTAPTCQKAGERKRVCDDCEHSETEAVEMKKYEASELHEAVKESIAEIKIFDKNGKELGLGSGFIYTESGEIVTNYHVIDGAFSAEVNINNKIYKAESVLAYDKDIDIAILRINNEGDTFKTIPLCTETHATGSNVYAVGSSLGLTDTFSRGIITNPNREVNGVIHVQHDAAITHGNSGGPLINEFGEIIGINASGVDGEDINFAISVTHLDKITRKTFTFEEFYNKEGKGYIRLKNYLMNNSKKDSDGDYTVIITSGSDYGYTATYNTQEDKITLALIITSKDFVYILDMTENSTVCEWALTFESDYGDFYYMDGFVDISGYAGSDTYIKTYDSSNIPTSLRLDCLELSNSFLSLIYEGINNNLTDDGITTASLGFKS